MPSQQRSWGKLWPLVVPDTNGPRCSQYLFDPYSLTHVLHGVILAWMVSAFYSTLVGTPAKTSDMIGLPLVLCVFLEVGWEVYENSETVISQFRSGEGSKDYHGDSYLNSFGDVLSMIIGYIFSVNTPAWAGVTYMLLSEMFLAWYCRDGLFLIILQLAVNPASVAKWQAGAFGGRRWVNGRLLKQG